MEFIDRLEKLRPKKMLYPHYGIIDNEEDCMTVIGWARRDNMEARDLIVDAHRKGMDVEEIKQLVKDRYYTDIIRKGQPEKAFDLTDRFSYVSTGGGALETFLLGQPLPVIDALKYSYEKY